MYRRIHPLQGWSEWPDLFPGYCVARTTLGWQIYPLRGIRKVQTSRFPFFKLSTSHIFCWTQRVLERRMGSGSLPCKGYRKEPRAREPGDRRPGLSASSLFSLSPAPDYMRLKPGPDAGERAREWGPPWHSHRLCPAEDMGKDNPPPDEGPG